MRSGWIGRPGRGRAQPRPPRALGYLAKADSRRQRWEQKDQRRKGYPPRRMGGMRRRIGLRRPSMPGSRPRLSASATEPKAAHACLHSTQGCPRVVPSCVVGLPWGLPCAKTGHQYVRRQQQGRSACRARFAGEQARRVGRLRVSTRHAGRARRALASDTLSPTTCTTDRIDHGKYRKATHA